MQRWVDQSLHMHALPSPYLCPVVSSAYVQVPPIVRSAQRYTWQLKCIDLCDCAVGPFQLPAPPSETLSWISSGTRPSVQTVSDVCLKRTCSLDTIVHSAHWRYLTITALYKFTYLLVCAIIKWMHHEIRFDTDIFGVLTVISMFVSIYSSSFQTI